MKKFLIGLLIVILIGGCGFGVYWFVFRNKSTGESSSLGKITISNYNGAQAKIYENESGTKFQIIVDDSAEDDSNDEDASQSLSLSDEKFITENLLYLLGSDGKRYDYTLASETSETDYSKEISGYWYDIPKSSLSFDGVCKELGLNESDKSLVLPRDVTLDNLQNYMDEKGISSDKKSQIEKIILSGKTVIISENGLTGFTKLKTVDNNRKTKEICSSACEELKYLENINTENVTKIGSDAFSGCEALKYVDLSSVLTIETGAFSECSKISTVKALKATTIESNAFKDCSTLSSLSLSEITTIGSNAFDGTKIASVNLPKSIRNIGKGAFDTACETTITFEGDSDWYSLLSNGDVLIDNNAFKKESLFCFKNLKSDVLTSEESSDVTLVTKLKAFLSSGNSKMKFSSENRNYVYDGQGIHYGVVVSGASSDCYTIAYTYEEGCYKFKVTNDGEGDNEILYLIDNSGNLYDFDKTYKITENNQVINAITKNSVDVFTIGETPNNDDQLLSTLLEAKNKSLLIDCADTNYASESYNFSLNDYYRTYVFSKDESKSLKLTQNVNKNVEIKLGNEKYTYNVKLADNKLTLSLTFNDKQPDNDEVELVKGITIKKSGSTWNIEKSGDLSSNSNIVNISTTVTDAGNDKLNVVLTFEIDVSTKTSAKTIYLIDKNLSATITESIASCDDCQYLIWNCGNGTKNDYYVKNGATQITLDGNSVSLSTGDNISDKIPAGYFVTQVDYEKIFRKYSNVFFSKNVTVIKKDLLNYTSRVTNVYISSGATEIQEGAFAGLTQLSNLSIPSNVAKVGNNILEGCTALKELTLSKCYDKTISDFYNSQPVFIETLNFEGTEINSAFCKDCTKLQNVNFLNKDLTIKGGAFSGCTKLQNVNFSEDIETLEIENLAFSGCTSLEEFVIPTASTITVKGDANGGVLSGCTKIKKITFPELSGDIDYLSYLGLSNVSELEVVYNGKDLKADSFKTSANVVSIYAPNYVCRVGTQPTGGSEKNVYLDIVSSEMTKLKTLNIPSVDLTDLEIVKKVANLDSLEDLTVKSLQASNISFNNTKLKNLTLKVEEISGFSGSNLSTVALHLDNVTTVNEETFKSAKLGNVDLPNVETIEKSAFNSATVGIISCPKVTTIGESAFGNISSTTFGINGNSGEINLPSIKTISENAFDGCTTITKCSLSNSLTDLGSNAFSNTKILSIELPSTTKIAAKAFENCNHLQSIKLGVYTSTYSPKEEDTANTDSKTANTDSKTANTDSNTATTVIKYFKEMFCNVTDSDKCNTITETDLAKCNLPSSLKKVEIDCGEWNDKLVEARKISESFFIGCSNIVTVKLVNCSSVEKKAFKDCSSLKNVDLCEDCLEIGDNAFENCKVLEKFNLKGNATLGENIFNGCSCEIEIGSTTIGKNVFAEYLGTTISLPNATSINENAFVGATELTTLKLGSYNTSVGFVTKYLDADSNYRVSINSYAIQRIYFDKTNNSSTKQYRHYNKLKITDKLATDDYWNFDVYIKEVNQNLEVSSDYTRIFDSIKTLENGSIYYLTKSEVWVDSEVGSRNFGEKIKIKLTRFSGGTYDNCQITSKSGVITSFAKPKIGSGSESYKEYDISGNFSDEITLYA